MVDKKKKVDEGKKLFTVNDITIGTFLTGPFTAILCMHHNYIALGKKEFAKKFKSRGISLLVAIFALSIFLPEIPSAVWVLAFTGGAWLYFKKTQYKEILVKFPKKDFPKKSPGKTILMMLGGLAMAVGVFFLLGFIEGFVSAFIS